MRPGLPPFEWWLHPPDILLRVYAFNVTNGESFVAGAEPRLRLQEVGPIVFRERLRHDGIAFNANGTLTYTAHRSLEPAPELSALRPDDPLVLPNLAVLGIASFLHDASVLTKYGTRLIMRRVASPPLVNITAHRFLWNNSDPLLDVIGTLVPSLLPTHNIGVFDWVYKNYSDQATVYVGPANADRFFSLVNFRGKPSLDFWPRASCNALRGASEGLFYRHGLTRNDTLTYFRRTSCRVGSLVYAGDAVRDGIDVFRYEMPGDFYNRTGDRDELCTAGPPSDPLLSGLNDLSACYLNFPLAASNPHFMYGHPSLLEAVEGLEPDPEKHTTYGFVEPITGIPIEGYARAQVSLVMHKISGFPAEVQRFSGIVIPVCWIEICLDGLPKNLSIFLYIVVKVIANGQMWFSCLLLVAGLAQVAAAALALRRDPQLRRHSLISLRLSPFSISNTPSSR